MIVKKTCPVCQGSGVCMIETSSFFGLLRKNIPATCDHCNGKGYIVETPACHFCEGQGLVGNERDICRACNGTGKVGTFGFIPRQRLKPGTHFERRCDECGASTFEIVSEVEDFKLTKTWEREEELRQVEILERVKVRCAACGQVYHIPLHKDLHQELSSEDLKALEDLGMNLSFMYKTH